MVDAHIGSNEELVKKISQVSTFDEAVQVADEIDDNVKNSRDTPGYVDILALKNRASEVQDAIQQSREELSMARAKLKGPAMVTAANPRNQVTEVVDSLGENIRPTDTPVDAEDLLKGDVTECDPASLDKIDGVLCKRKLSTEENQIHKDSTVKAEDLLKKKDGAVVVDPSSLDKIDGLPRVHGNM